MQVNVVLGIGNQGHQLGLMLAVRRETLGRQDITHPAAATPFADERKCVVSA